MSSAVSLESKTAKTTPAQLRRVLACALAYKKYLDTIKDRGERLGERDAFMKGFNAGAESINGSKMTATITRGDPDAKN